MTTLYAWAIPANAIAQWADHTWVTSFDVRATSYRTLDEVAAHGQWLWMCWGSYHPQGGAPGHPDGLLQSAAGRLNLARCLVTPNADSVHVSAARGAVQIYGIQGMCHQVAHEVLLATRGSQAAISVKGARGYPESVYIYGQYGLAHGAWTKAVHHCGGNKRVTQELTAMADDFAERARHVLVDRDELFGQLMAMRSAYQVRLLGMRAVAGLSAEDIDRQHHEHLSEVANLIGRENFTAIFDHPPEVEVNLVDPDIYAASRAGPSLDPV